MSQQKDFERELARVLAVAKHKIRAEAVDAVFVISCVLKSGEVQKPEIFKSGDVARQKTRELLRKSRNASLISVVNLWTGVNGAICWRTPKGDIYRLDRVSLA